MPILRNPNPNGRYHPGDGMSAVNSQKQQRAELLDRLLDEPSPDCIEYGFYMGEYWKGPIPDYFGDCVKREIKT